MVFIYAFIGLCKGILFVISLPFFALGYMFASLAEFGNPGKDYAMEYLTWYESLFS